MVVVSWGEVGVREGSGYQITMALVYIINNV